MKLLDIKKEKYQNLPKNKLGVAIIIKFKYQGKLVYSFPYRFFLYPFFSKNLEIAFQDVFQYFYDSYRDFLRDRGLGMCIDRKIVRGEEVFFSTNSPNYTFMLKFRKGLKKKKEEDLVDADYFYMDMGSCPPFNEILRIKFNKMFYSQYKKDIKSIKLMIKKFYFWLYKDLPKSKLPNCVDHFDLNREINIEEYFSLEEIKELIETFKMHKNNLAVPDCNYSIFKEKVIPEIEYEKLKEYLLNLYGKGGELELHNFDEKYLSNFTTLDSLINIYYAFSSRHYYYEEKEKIIEKGEGVDHSKDITTGNIWPIYHSYNFYYSIIDFFKL